MGGHVYSFILNAMYFVLIGVKSLPYVFTLGLMDTCGTASADVDTMQEALSLRSRDHAVTPPSSPLEAVTVNT